MNAAGVGGFAMPLHRRALEPDACLQTALKHSARVACWSNVGIVTLQVRLRMSSSPLSRMSHEIGLIKCRRTCAGTLREGEECLPIMAFA